MPLAGHDGNSITMSRNHAPQRPGSAGILPTLALCALLGASTSMVTGATLGIALLVAVTLSVLIFAASRASLSPALQPAAFVVLFAGCVTAADLLLRAWWPAQHRELGIFLSLSVAAGPLLASAETFIPVRTKTESLKASVVAGVTFACAATVLGGLREFAGSGPGGDNGFLLALLPPGALIGMGILMAAWNRFAERDRNR